MWVIKLWHVSIQPLNNTFVLADFCVGLHSSNNDILIFSLLVFLSLKVIKHPPPTAPHASSPCFFSPSLVHMSTRGRHKAGSIFGCARKSLFHVGDRCCPVCLRCSAEKSSQSVRELDKCIKTRTGAGQGFHCFPPLCWKHFRGKYCAF